MNITRHYSIAVFLIMGWTLQLIAFYYMPDGWLSLISGLFGVCSVVLCSGANIWTFAFGFVQIASYMYICYTERLYGEIAMNSFYFISQIYGLIIWHRRTQNNTLITRNLQPLHFILLSAMILTFSIITGYLLQRFTNDSQPYMDALTTIPAIAAQALMVMAYRENWFLWLFIDIAATIMWLQAENYCMATQYTFWCIVAVYGLYRWKKQE